MIAAAEPVWVGDVWRFWFEETPPEARFNGPPALDQAIRHRFFALYEAIAAAPPPTRVLTARSGLAAIVVLDQFPRNMFRGSARAFASDGLARRLARDIVAAGLDAPLAPACRLFLYLPFEHSEALADQERSVALIGTLGDARLDDYARRHLEIIRRFGRFPHRNQALRRASTREEAAFLLAPESAF